VQRDRYLAKLFFNTHLYQWLRTVRIDLMDEVAENRLSGNFAPRLRYLLRCKVNRVCRNLPSVRCKEGDAIDNDYIYWTISR